MNVDVSRAVRLLTPVLLLAPSTYLSDSARWLDRAGVVQAVADHNTPALFEWFVPLLALQGISDLAAFAFANRHAPVKWAQVDQTLGSSQCPRLRSYWNYRGCGYRKVRFTCGERDRLANCSVPALPLRKGVLNEAAVALHLFMRDACAGDFVDWLDRRLAAADPGPQAPDRGRTLTTSVIEPLCHVAGTGPKLWSMILADLFLAGDPARERWQAAGASMIVVDSLVHAFLHRTGILRDFAAEHGYGTACYTAGGCADVLDALAASIDARRYNPAFPTRFPRFLAKAIWRFCAESGHGICNGRRINDRLGCEQVFCPAFSPCRRLTWPGPA